jgi:hypothetical protein
MVLQGVCKVGNSLFFGKPIERGATLTIPCMGLQDIQKAVDLVKTFY